MGVEGVGGGLGALDLQFGLAVDAGVVGEVEGVLEALRTLYGAEKLAGELVP